MEDPGKVSVEDSVDDLTVVEDPVSVDDSVDDSPVVVNCFEISVEDSVDD